VVTLCGQVDRKSDVGILVRVVREIDGVVDVTNDLSYRWNDTGPDRGRRRPARESRQAVS